MGWLVPRGGLIQIAARSSGTLTQLLIKEGDAVRAGQPIARVRLSTVLASGQEAGAAAQQALSSEAAAITGQASASEKKLRDELASLGPKLADFQAQITQTAEQIRLQEGQVRIARDDLARFQKLADSGDIAPRLVSDRLSNLYTQQQTLARMRGDLLALKQQSADIVARQQAIPAEIAQATANAEQAQAQVTQKQVQNDAADADVMVASVSGRVLAIPVEVGQSLTPGTTLAIIAPQNSHLEAELYAPSSAVGFVHPGETVRLMYQAFPHEKFGTAKGTVSSLSHTILSPADVALPGSGIQQPVFRVRAALARQNVNAYGQTIPLQPGMLLKADIVLERRTLLEWLFDPIYAAIK